VTRAPAFVAALVSLAVCSTGTWASANTVSSQESKQLTAIMPTSRPAADVGIQGQLLFTRTKGLDVQTIYTMSGRWDRRLTAPGDFCCLLRVSPDHQRILVMPGVDSIVGGTINLDGGDFQPLKNPDPSLSLVPQAWSPDGTRIAFQGWDFSDPGRTGVYTARASDGGALVRVTSRPGESPDIPLDYSPNGKWLVFYRSATVNPDDQVGGSLWVVGVDGSDPHQVAGPKAQPAPWARWSKDSRRILFANERTAQSGALWTVAHDGTQLSKLFSDAQGRFPLDPTWSPDGSHILFALDPTNDEFTHPDNGLYTITAQGTDLQLVNGSHDCKRQPEWWK
jgi:Tol biopolymer transport system component